MRARPVRRAPRSKYGAQPTIVEGTRFASKAEARRYSELLLLARAGEIVGLELQPRFVLWALPHGCVEVVGVPVGTYIADFRYYQRDGELVIEDVKGMAGTAVYNLKKRIVEVQYGITVREVRYR